MHVCGQTLILVDNDATVSEVNQKLVRATLNYMSYHLPGDRAFSVNTYEHDVTGDENFMTESGDIACEAGKIEYAAKDSNLSDTLCEVITRWKESDFACRDIVVFTDGLEGGALDHEKEELYYLLENSEYPVYVVMLDQENNAEAKKGLSAIAVTSGGKFFETDFPGSEAEVDKQLCERIFASMDEYASVHWGKYEEIDDGSSEVADSEAADSGESITQTTEDVSETTESEEYGANYDMSGKVIYEYDRTPGFFESTGALILSVVLIASGLIFGILAGFVMMKRRRRASAAPAPYQKDDDDDLFGDYELGGMSTTELTPYGESDTVFLSDSGSGSECPTRLLTEPDRIVTLTDREHDGRVFKIVLGKVMSIGRGNCDVMISGDDALSKRHCELYEKDGEIYIQDLASSNGTRVNGVKINIQKLSDGDEIAIGSKTYTVGL